MNTAFLIATNVIFIGFAAYEWVMRKTAESCLRGHMQANDKKHQQVKRLKEDNEGLHRQLERERYGHERDLRQEKDYHNDRTADLRADLKEYRALVKKKQAIIGGYVFSDVIAIKFTAHIPNTGWHRTEFKLGIGPCGKEVTALHWKEKDDRYELTQTCTDGERKEFTYYKKDVEGRIEITYKALLNRTH